MKSNEKLLSSITSVMSCFRDFCAIMWLLQARDRMSKSSRKYRQLRSQSLGSEEVGTSLFCNTSPEKNRTKTVLLHRTRVK